MYTDDTTAFLHNDSSAASLLTFLDQFGDLSSLKINQSRRKSLWLSPLKSQFVKDDRFGISWPKQYLIALGIAFSYHDQVGDKINFDERLAKPKNVLNTWSSRHLTIWGRIAIVKILALAKLVYSCSVLNIPEEFVKEVNSNIFSFIWNFTQIKSTEKLWPAQYVTAVLLCSILLKLLNRLRLCGAIPKTWKSEIIISQMGITNQFHPLTSPLLKSPCDASKRSFSPPIVEINLRKQVSNLKVVYELPLKVTVENKMRSFQFKLIYNIIPTNHSLYKMIVASPKCERCLFQMKCLFTCFLNAPMLNLLENIIWWNASRSDKTSPNNIEILYSYKPETTTCYQ